MRNWLALAGFVVLCLAVGALGGWATVQSVAEWYPALNKPSWTPPPWVFAPVWTMLYILMGLAAWLVWRKGNARTAMVLFGIQLLLNLAWSFLFFGARSPVLGLVDIVVLWFAIAAMILAYFSKSRLAALMMLPYLAWVSFATALNAAIYALN